MEPLAECSERRWTLKTFVQRPPPETCLAAFLASPRKMEVLGEQGVRKFYGLGLISREEAQALTNLPLGERRGYVVDAAWFTFDMVWRSFTDKALMGLIDEGVVQDISNATLRIKVLNHKYVSAVRDNFDPVIVSKALARACGRTMALSPLSHIDVNQNAFDLALEGVLPEHMDKLMVSFQMHVSSSCDCMAGRLDFLWHRGIKATPAFFRDFIVGMKMFAPELCSWMVERNVRLDMNKVRADAWDHARRSRLALANDAVHFTRFAVPVHPDEIVHRSLFNYIVPTIQGFHRIFYYMVGRRLAPCDVNNVFVLLGGNLARNTKSPLGRFARRDGDKAIADRVARMLPFW